MQLQMQQQMNDSVQQDLQKAHDTSKKLDNLARTFLALITDPSQQSQLLAEFESISKNGTPQMPVMTPPMMNAVAAMQPHMMMRNPMLNAMGGASPRVSGKGGAPQNGGMNGMSMMQHMQMQAFQAQMMQAQMFQQMPMMMPGMVPGMPPGMAGLPGMMPPNNMAAAMQHFNAFQQMAAAASVAVSTPSRNPSTSGAASRTRTPLTTSATNSPRPTTEPTIKEEEPQTMEHDVAAAVAATTATATIKQEENSTVAVA